MGIMNLDSRRSLNKSHQIALSKQFGYSSWDRYASRAEFLFKDITLTGKHVLDVGCGQGAWAAWCALHEASVVALEPEADGSTSDNFVFF